MNILLIGIGINIIAAIYFIVDNYSKHEDLIISEFILLIVIVLIPFSLSISALLSFIDFDKPLIKGKKK